MATSLSTTRTDLAGAFSIGAGLVHAAAAGTHSGATTLVWLFTASALLQVAVGAWLLANPSRRALLVGAGVNLVCVGAWVASRTTGIPFIADLHGREAVGTQDLLCALLGFGALVFAAWALLPRETTSPAHRLIWLPALVLLPAVFGVAAPHAHGDDHTHAVESAEHAPTDTEEADDGHAHAADEAEVEHAHDEPTADVVTLAGHPALSGAETSHATEAELETAVDLVDETRAAVNAAYTDTASAEAAGYVWIGDGRRVGRFQHYINPAYLADDHQLDPEHIESLVFENTAAGPVLVTTMFILDFGQTMDDVPDVAGDLTVWHDHQNLCWDDSGTMLAGVSTDGQTCRPSGTLRATPPMLHVWLVDNPCGPFAGVDGHGAEGSSCAAHEH